MITLISPSKSQDFSPPPLTQHSIPDFLEESAILIERLRQFSPLEIRELMDVSIKIAELNALRYATWQQPFTLQNSKQALLAFTGDVYGSIESSDYQADDFDFAQKSLRILSGLYGILRPLDLIQPYRLEMKIKLATSRGPNLYHFWRKTLTYSLNNLLKETQDPLIINLASVEYFSAIDVKQLNANIITPVFKEYKNGTYTVVALFAKRARGAMANFIIRERITKPEGLRHFEDGGYQFNPTLSTEKEWVFTRGK